MVERPECGISQGPALLSLPLPIPWVGDCHFCQQSRRGPAATSPRSGSSSWNSSCMRMDSTAPWFLCPGSDCKKDPPRPQSGIPMGQTQTSAALTHPTQSQVHAHTGKDTHFHALAL